MSSSPSPPETDLPKAVGRYEVLRLIGEGAMGRVLLAHDPVLGRDVAVKLLRDDLRVPREVRQGLLVRMRHEARAAARVAHPNLVTLHDMGEDDQQGLYLVLEYVEGLTLKQQLLQGRLPPEQAARLARDLGAALTVAHDAGVLHRDVKPDNIILSKTGGKIADFGIAKIPDSTLTQTGGLMGTPAYSAPETLRGSNFSAESDQFSFAASLYEALSGERAFKGDDAVEVALRISQDPAEPFAARLDFPAAVDGIFARAMSKDPKERFPSCESFGDALATSLAAAGRAGAANGTAGSPDAHRRAGAAGVLPERKTGHVVIGAAVVVVTAALLVRTALRSAADTGDDLPPAVPSASASSTPDPPKAKVALPASRPKVKADLGEANDERPAEASSATRPTAEPDAGRRDPPDAAAPDRPADAGPPAPATSSSAPSKVDAGP